MKWITKKSLRHRFVELFVIIALLVVLLGKILLRDDQGLIFLAVYGVTVTLVLWMTFFVAFLVYKDPYKVALEKEHKGITPPKKDLFVSCMVAVKDEEKNIARCVDSMLNQTYKNKEIIVVNDASTDGTLEILRDYEAKGKIQLINLEQNVGKKRALAQAMLVAKGDIYAHTDSDSVWAPDVIEKIEKIFEYFPDVGAVSGHGRALNGDDNLLTKIQDSWMEGQFSVRKSFESVFGAVTCVSGPLAVFRKEAVFNFIPAWMFDTFLGQEFKFATDRTMTGFVLGSKAVGEKLKKKYQDSVFIKSANYPVKEWKVVYCKSAKSWTIVPDTFKRLLRQQIRWKKSFIRNSFFTGSFFWRRPLPVAFVYYVHILFVLVGPFIVFRHLIYLPLQGNIFSALLYVSGVLFVGFTLGLAYKLENKHCHKWIYRPGMSILSTFVLTWLVFYSALTIRKMTWIRS